MRTLAAIVALVGFSVAPAWGQDLKEDPVETALARQWQAAQTGQQNVADAIGKLVEAYRREKARADAAEAKLKTQPETK